MADRGDVALIRELTEYFRHFSEVAAIGLGGSRAQGRNDAQSDIDFYLFTRAGIEPLRRNAFLAQRPASRADMALSYWDVGDEWIDSETAINVDLIQWDARWIAQKIDEAWVSHKPSLGYSTCFVHTLRSIHILHDADGFLAALKAKCQEPYPEALGRAIVRYNYPVLRAVIPSFRNQVKKAASRGDWLSVNHRSAAFFASYFDVVFALNCVTHPGEKRMLEHVATSCAVSPSDLIRRVGLALDAAGRRDGSVVERLDELVDALDQAIAARGWSLT